MVPTSPEKVTFRSFALGEIQKTVGAGFIQPGGDIKYVPAEKDL
jgi:hypothetical protein